MTRSSVCEDKRTRSVMKESAAVRRGSNDSDETCFYAGADIEDV